MRMSGASSHILNVCYTTSSTSRACVTKDYFEKNKKNHGNNNLVSALTALANKTKTDIT